MDEPALVKGVRCQLIDAALDDIQLVRDQVRVALLAADAAVALGVRGDLGQLGFVDEGPAVAVASIRLEITV